VIEVCKAVKALDIAQGGTVEGRMALLDVIAGSRMPRPRCTSSPFRAIAVGFVFVELLMVGDVNATAVPTSTPTSAPTSHDNGISSETEAIIFGIMAAVICISLCYFGFDKKHTKVHHHDPKDDLPHEIHPSYDSGSDANNGNGGNEGAATDEPRPAEMSPPKAAVTVTMNCKDNKEHPASGGGEGTSLSSAQEV
jgi:hypothetical protein